MTVEERSFKYAVGQVLYCISSKDSKIMPALVTEEITKKTIAGSAVTYKIQFGADESKTMLIDDFKGEMFTSPDELKRTLIDRASSRLAKIVDEAANRALAWYGNATSVCESREDANSDLNGYVADVEEEERTYVTLPDGTRARLVQKK